MNPQTQAFKSLNNGNVNLAGALAALASTEYGSEFMDQLMDSLQKTVPNVVKNSIVCEAVNEELIKQGFNSYIENAKTEQIKADINAQQIQTEVQRNEPAPSNAPSLKFML